jgi:hypothetical protein
MAGGKRRPASVADGIAGKVDEARFTEGKILGFGPK